MQYEVSGAQTTDFSLSCIRLRLLKQGGSKDQICQLYLVAVLSKGEAPDSTDVMKDHTYQEARHPALTAASSASPRRRAIRQDIQRTGISSVSHHYVNGANSYYSSYHLNRRIIKQVATLKGVRVSSLWKATWLASRSIDGTVSFNNNDC